MLYIVEEPREFAQSLLDETKVVAPMDEGGVLVFGEISSSKDILFTQRNTERSPKWVVFPQEETLFFYKEGEVKKEKGNGKRVLFGVRPCDVRGFSILDKVFLNGKFEDTYYKERRTNTIIFGLSCNEPKNSCFCTSFEIGPFYKDGMDVFMVDLGERWLLEGITDKGKEILKGKDLKEPSSEDLERADELKKEAEKAIEERIDIEKLKVSLSFDSEIWGKTYLRCLGCGVCSFLCPTCHCFDIIDEGKEMEGRRIRIWDSCSFPLFTLHASGHQPRPTQLERFRQRILHKFIYFVERSGEIACVGCGRCIISCPVNLDLREVLK